MITATYNLDKRFKLYKASLIDDGQGGQEVGPIECVGTIWGKLLKPRFAEVEAAGSPASLITQGIVIHKQSITTEYKIEYNGTTYTILHIDCSDKEYITLTCTVAINNG